MAQMASLAAMLKTQTSALGNKAAPDVGKPAPAAARGFTLLELMIVVALIAIASSVASLALRDPAATRLEREATRLAALLESARSESRTLGQPVIWLPIPLRNSEQAQDFQFIGLPPSLGLPVRWLDEGVSAQIEGATPASPGIILGPEPMMAPARIVLRLDEQRVVMASDGLGPFQIELISAADDGALGAGAEYGAR